MPTSTVPTLLLTLDLSTGTKCCRFIRRSIESAAVLTSGPSANVSNMASRASLITHKLFWLTMMSRKTVPKDWKDKMINALAVPPWTPKILYGKTKKKIKLQAKSFQNRYETFSEMKLPKINRSRGLHSVDDERRQGKHVKTAVREKQCMFESKISKSLMVNCPLTWLNSWVLYVSQICLSFNMNFKVHLITSARNSQTFWCLFILAKNILSYREV